MKTQMTVNEAKWEATGRILVGKATKSEYWLKVGSGYDITFFTTTPDIRPLEDGDLVFIPGANGTDPGQFAVVGHPHSAKGFIQLDWSVNVQASLEYQMAVMEGKVRPVKVVDPEFYDWAVLNGKGQEDDWDWVRKMKATNFNHWGEALASMVEYTAAVKAAGGVTKVEVKDTGQVHFFIKYPQGW